MTEEVTQSFFIDQTGRSARSEAGLTSDLWSLVSAISASLLSDSSACLVKPGPLWGVSLGGSSESSIRFGSPGACAGRAKADISKRDPFSVDYLHTKRYFPTRCRPALCAHALLWPENEKRTRCAPMHKESGHRPTKTLKRHRFFDIHPRSSGRPPSWLFCLSTSPWLSAIR